MKTALAAVAALAALAWLIPPDDAEARNRGYRAKGAGHGTVGYYRRPASVGPNGLCQRDTGTPTGDLNFRNRCDVEEFWNRMSRGRRR